MSSAELSTAMLRSEQQQHFNSTTNINNSFSLQSSGHKPDLCHVHPHSHSHSQHVHAHVHQHAHQHTDHRQCRGSLPLKKRRFQEITSYEYEYHHNHKRNHHGNSIHDMEGSASTGGSSAQQNLDQQQQQQHIQQQQQMQQHMEQLVANSCNTADERFAALALVAAATASGGGINGINGLHGMNFSATGTSTNTNTGASASTSAENGNQHQHQQQHQSGPSPYSLSSAAAATVAASQALSLAYAPAASLTTSSSMTSKSGTGASGAVKNGNTSVNLALQQVPSTTASTTASASTNIKPVTVALKNNHHHKVVTKKTGGNNNSNINKQPSISNNTNTSSSTTTSTTTTTKPQQQRQRVNHPPLTAPIPGGCHGRTSRNNSYCRRTPCYNGSKYCKLHYQQYVVNGDNNNNNNNNNKINNNNNSGKNSNDRLNSKGNEDNSNNSSNKSSNSNNKGTGRSQKFSENEGGGGENSQNSTSTSTNTSGNNNNTTTGNSSSSSSHRHHQDKRYTGLTPDEVQCLATTTRGRPCAYVAVGKTKYCHLHADYDTNPPPRRGGGGGQKSSKNTITTTTTNMNTNTTTISQSNNRVMNMTANSNANNNVQNLMSIARIATQKIKDHSSLSSSSFQTSITKNGTNALPQGVNSIPTSHHKNGTGIGIGIGIVEEFKSKTQGRPSKSGEKTKRNITQSSSSMMIHNPPLHYPLLNSIPSDKWSNKKVLIGTGPLVNHIGRVTKWGNGWVTVSTATATGVSGSGSSGKSNSNIEASSNEILHNRRAIELYLLPDDVNCLPIVSNRSSSSDVSTSVHVPVSAPVSVPVSVPYETSKSDVPSFESTTILNCIQISEANPTNVLQQQPNQHVVDSTLMVPSKSSSIKDSKVVTAAVGPTEMVIVKEVKEKNFEKTLQARGPVKDSVQKTQAQTQDAIFKQSTKEQLVDVKNEESACENLQERISIDSLGGKNKVLKKEKLLIEPALEEKQLDAASTLSVHETNTVASRSGDVPPFKVKKEPDNLPLNSTEKVNTGCSQDLNQCLHSERIEESTDDKDTSSIKVSTEIELTQDNGNEEPQPGKKLTLMEELILAQTGRRVKNVDLALCSGGGRTIHKPKRYEDKTLIKKKRNRQQHDGEHDEEGSKRKKLSMSPGRQSLSPSSKSFCRNSSSNTGDLSAIKFKDSPEGASQSFVADAQSDHQVKKIKA